MKIITIEQVGNGGRTKVEEEKIMLEEINEIYNSEYSNALTIVDDLRKFAFQNCDTISKHTKGNKIVLKSDNGSIINLINFEHKVLHDEINNEIINSYKNFLYSMNKIKYDTVYLTAQQNRTSFNFMETSPKSKNGFTAFVELELDENNELTFLGKIMLDALLKKELRNWGMIFLADNDSNIFKIYYDDKKMLVNPNLIKYVKPEAEKIQNFYLESLEKINKERGI